MLIKRQLPRNKNNSSKKQRIVQVGILLAVFLLLAGAWWWLGIRGDRAQDTTANIPESDALRVPALDGAVPDAVMPNTEPNPDPNVPGGSTGSTSGPYQVSAPTGNFVSTHTISLGANTELQSVCSTSIGAECYITFTKDTTTKSLERKATDEEGTVAWNWKPSDLGLSEGNWQIKAVALSNEDSKTTTDVLPLRVQP